MIVTLNLQITNPLQLSIDYIDKSGEATTPLDQRESDLENHCLAQSQAIMVRYFKTLRTDLSKTRKDKILPQQKLNSHNRFLLKSIENQMVLYNSDSSVYSRRKSKTIEDADKKEHTAISVDNSSDIHSHDRRFQLVYNHSFSINDTIAVVTLNLKINIPLQHLFNHINKTGTITIPFYQCENHRLELLKTNMVKYVKNSKAGLNKATKEKILSQQKLNSHNRFLLKSIENQMVLFNSVYSRRNSKTFEDVDLNNHNAIAVDGSSDIHTYDRGSQLVCIQLFSVGNLIIVVTLNLGTNTSLQLTILQVDRTGEVIDPFYQCEFDLDDHRLAPLRADVATYLKSLEADLDKAEQGKLFPQQKLNGQNIFLLNSILDQMAQFTDDSSGSFRGTSQIVEIADKKEHTATSVDGSSDIQIYDRRSQLDCMIHQNRAFIKPIKPISKRMIRSTIARSFYARKRNFGLSFNDKVTKLVFNGQLGINTYKPQFFNNKLIEEGKNNREIKQHTKYEVLPPCLYDEIFGKSEDTYPQHLAYESGVDMDAYWFPDPPPPYGDHKRDKFVNDGPLPVYYELIKINIPIYKIDQFLGNYLKNFNDYHRVDIDKKRREKKELNTTCYRQLVVSKKVKLFIDCNLPSTRNNIFQMESSI